MWFSEKSKENIIWLRDQLAAASLAASSFVRRHPALAVIAVLLTLAGTAESYRYRFEIQSFLENGHDGKILVNSPTVYTRQRLVNDRLDQALWLRDQLKLTQDSKNKVFNSIDQIQHTSSEMVTKIGEAGVGDQKDLTPVDAIEPTTTALFRAKNAYREEVRSEITQAELDDRHDIKGNTIFRLTFDASIIAGNRKDSVAAIGVNLSHHPETSDPSARRVYEDDYESLYEDWVRYFQVTIRKSLSNIPYSIVTPKPYPRLRLLFSSFLFQRLCQFMHGDSDISKDPVDCDSSMRSAAERLLTDFTDTRAKSLTEQRKLAFMEALHEYRLRNYRFPIQDAETADASLYKKAITICPQTNKTQIGPWELDIIRANTNNIREDTKNVSGDGINSINDSIGCPYYDNINERMISGVLLYEAMYLLAKSENRDRPHDSVENYKEQLHKFYSNCAEEKCQIQLSSLKCYVADFIKSDLNGFGKTSSPTQKKVRHFLSLEIVGREVNDCDILVQGLPSKYFDVDDEIYDEAQASLENGTSNKNIQSKFTSFSISEEFSDYLNANTDAFSYSVTPKNLTENISTAAETRDAYELLFRAAGENKDIANILRERSEKDQSVIAHPVIVGFGSSRYSIATLVPGKRDQRKLTGIRSVDFGWVIGPRSRTSRIFEQVDGQYPLTVFISVPSWWRTVELSVETCWLSRLDLANLTPKDWSAGICLNHTELEPSKLFVRLPSAIPEVSRKLGFDVLQEPSLYEPSPKELVVGQPGSLLLEGARLWRSTEVTAASQRADRINVLPNMDGIIAKFKCVHPPTGPRQTRKDRNNEEQLVTMDSARVWTSEGVTEAIPVMFIWPNKDWIASLNNCPDEDESLEGTSNAITTGRKQALESVGKTEEKASPPATGLPRTGSPPGVR